MAKTYEQKTEKSQSTSKTTLTYDNLIPIILLPLIIILISTGSIITDRNLQKNFIDKEHNEAHDKIIDYLLYRGELPEGLMTDEIEHLAEVRMIIIAALLLFLVICATFLMLVVRNPSTILLIGASLTILVITLISIIPFEMLFIKFHQSIFTTVWQFPEEALLIQIYGGNFFETMLVKIIKRTAIITTTILIACIIQTAKQHYQKKQ